VAQRRIVQRVSVEEQQRAPRTKAANMKYHRGCRCSAARIFQFENDRQFIAPKMAKKIRVSVPFDQRVALLGS
jgi:hypothetical protein